MIARDKQQVKVRTWLILFACYAALQITSIFQPFFWDELGVYGPAAIYMHDNGLSLMPASMPPDLSRGHPLLFTCFHAAAMYVFGDSAVGGHITGLLITCILLWSIVYIATRVYNAPAAWVAVFIIAMQPLFAAQAVLVLPEMALALLMLWSLYFWHIKKYWLFALFATMAMLTKETAIILPVVVWCGSAAEWIKTRKRPEKLWQICTAPLLPIITYGIFLLIQKWQNGWYFFPFHGEGIRIAIQPMLRLARGFVHFLFWEQGRVCYLFLCLPVFWIVLRSKVLQWNGFSVLLVFLVLGGVLFSSMSFDMDRYLLFVLVGMLLLFAPIIVKAIFIYKGFRYVAAAVLIVPAFYISGDPFENMDPSIGNEAWFHYDTDKSYLRYNEVMESAVSLLFSDKDKPFTVAANFPLSFALRDPRYGFIDDYPDAQLTVINMSSQPPPDIIIVSDPGSIGHPYLDPKHFEEIQIIDKQHITFRFYRPKNQSETELNAP